MEAALSLGDGDAFPSSNQIVIYASAANAAAAARSQAAAVRAQTTAPRPSSVTRFSLYSNQSASSFQSVNSFYQQLQAAAQGNGATITLAQAEQQISTIVANRTSLAAAAQAVNAPTPAASTVRDDLVAAFNASLRNDNDLDTCLNQANDRHRRLHLPRMPQRQRHRQRGRHRGQADLPGRLQSAADPHRASSVNMQF